MEMSEDTPRLLGRNMVRTIRVEKTWEEAKCFLCVPSEWNQRLWKLRSLEKEVHGKTKGYGHKQSQVRNIGNGLASLRLRGRVSVSKKTPETQGSEHTGDIMRDGS